MICSSKLKARMARSEGTREWSERWMDETESKERMRVKDDG